MKKCNDHTTMYFSFSIFLIFCYNTATSQNMNKEKFPRMLSKKEVEIFIKSGEAKYDSILSIQESLDVYKFSDGRIIFKRVDGKGAYWKSVEQINEIMNKAESETNVLNMRNWIKNRNDFVQLKKMSLQLLEKKTGKAISYNNKSLLIVNKIKINDIVKEKDLLYSIIYFCCEIFTKRINGKIDFKKINSTNDYRPIVIDSNGNSYLPYSEYLESFVEKTQITLKQSIEIEMDKYELVR